MLDTIFGLPTHALVIHLVVILLPLAAAGGIVVALVPALRRRYGELVVLATVAAAAAVPVATHSGEHLLVRKSATFGPGSDREAGLMGRHATLGHQLWPWSVTLLVGVLIVVGLPLLLASRRTAAGAETSAGPETTAARHRRRSSTWARGLTALAVLAVLVGGVGSTVMVVRIGDAGAKAVWSTLPR
jgi:hypothetical protein